MFNNFYQKLLIKLSSIPVKKRIKKLGKDIPIYFDYNVSLDKININTLNTEVNSKTIFSLKPIIIKVVDNGSLNIQELTVRSGCYISASGPVKMGLNCFLNKNCTILSRVGVKIGHNLMCADNVYIRDNDGHKLTKDGKRNTPKPITIGNNVWVGRGATILKGVTIGDNVVIGAGSIVTKDIPPNCIAAGHPAKVIYKGKLSWAQ